MLIEFSVKNYKCFKDKVTLSMEKGIGDENKDNVFSVSDLELLKTVVIYGANASGKSTLISAFTTAILMVRSSNLIPVGFKWNNVVPFMFDEEHKNMPTTFEFKLIVNKVKYIYSFSADKEKIYDESLDAYYTQKPSSIFVRKNTNNYTFINDESKLKQIASKNTDNKLFLATATNWNYEKTKDAFLWFINSIDTFYDFNLIHDEDMINYNKNDNDLKKFALKLFKEADIAIKNINVDVELEEIDSTTASMLLPPFETSKIKKYNIELVHEIEDEKGKKHLYELNFNDESSGTRILFSLAPFLKRAFEMTKIIIVDELEKSLHPSLVEYLIRIFHNPNINKSNSQLIFTTHAATLLDLDLFRRDEIWFTEKNSVNGVADVFPLDDFPVRKSENIQKGYLNGKYGAIPFINENYLKEKENKNDRK